MRHTHQKWAGAGQDPILKSDVHFHCNMLQLQGAAVTRAQCPACKYEITPLKMSGLPLSDLERRTHCGIFPVLIKGVTGTA